MASHKLIKCLCCGASFLNVNWIPCRLNSFCSNECEYNGKQKNKTIEMPEDIKIAQYGHMLSNKQFDLFWKDNF